MRRDRLWWGLGLVAIGAVSLFRVLGHEWATMYSLWPLVLIGGGTVSLAGAIRSRNGNSAWFGVISIASGALFLFITLLGGEWNLLSNGWPMFFGFASLGWAAVWIIGPRRASTLVLSLLAALGCLVAGQYVQNGLGETASAFVRHFWLLALPVLGATIFVDRYMRLKHADRD